MKKKGGGKENLVLMQIAATASLVGMTAGARVVFKLRPRDISPRTARFACAGF